MNESNLHPYQNTAVDHILVTPYCGLFLEMGLGKTISTLTAINTLMYRDLEVNRVLVIAPKRVVESVWTQEANKWEHTRHLKFSQIIGTAAQRKQALQKPADIYLISRDNIAWLIELFGGNQLPFDMLVIDELTSFKNPKSKRFKALRQVSMYFRRIVGLTGSPAPNGLIDIWAQVFLLDRGKRLGKYITHFRDTYFVPGKTNGMIVYSYVLRDKAAERIYEKIGDICMSMKAKDYLDLPGRIDNVIEIEMPPALRKQYDQFEEEQVMLACDPSPFKQLELFGEVPDEPRTITAVNAAVLSGKLLQFANGAIYDDDGGVQIIHDLKIEAAKEVVEQANGKPVLIGWTFRHDRDRLKEALKEYKPRELKNPGDVDEWNEGKIQVLLMHPASGGHGLNLQSGGHIILWFGNPWGLELEQQFNARIDRQGQEEVVIINKLVVKGTMDEDVIKSQKNKARSQDALMEAVKARADRYAKLFKAK